MLVSSRVIKRGWEIVELAMKVSSGEYGEYGWEISSTARLIPKGYMNAYIMVLVYI